MLLGAFDLLESRGVLALEAKRYRYICRQKLYFIVFSAAFIESQGCHQYYFKLAQLKVI